MTEVSYSELLGRHSRQHHYHKDNNNNNNNSKTMKQKNNSHNNHNKHHHHNNNIKLFLPTELILVIFSYLPIQDLANQRLVSRHWHDIAKSQLIQDFKQQISSLHLEYKHAHTKYSDREQVMRPHLRHYTAFLHGISPQDVIEATWYSHPPEELQTVCECLCLLREAADSEYLTLSSSSSSSGNSRTHGQTENSNHQKRMPWSHIKKLMSKYEFRQWLIGLQEHVEHIPLQNAKKVEQIVVQDSSITYERLREVSLAGYKLLIYVAACLQYVSISHDLKEYFKVQDDLSKKLYKTKQFLNYLQ